MKALRKKLCIDDYLYLIKENPNYKMAYISFLQYIFCLEREIEKLQLEKKQQEILKERINKALEIAYQYAQIDGSHHRIWVIDQMLRELLGNKYKSWVKEYEEYDYKWDIGIAP